MHPVLLRLGDSFFLGTYGLMIALGLLAAIALAAWRGRRRGFQPDLFLDLAFIGVLAGFVFARLFYILLNWGEFTADPGGVIFSRGGFVFLGGFVGAVAISILYLRRKALPVLAIGDIVAPSIAVAHAFGRIGCHFAGCCWGGVCSVPHLGLRVPQHQLPGGGYFENAAMHFPGEFVDGVLHSQPVWPVQLMESFGLFALAGALLLFATRPRRPGQTLALYLGFYSVLRFVLEFLRGDADRGLFFGGALSTSQLLSLAILPVAVALWAWSLRQPISPHSHPSTAPPLPAPEAKKPDDDSGDSPAAPARKRRNARRPAARR